MKALVGLLCGVLFGIGLTVSQMVDPNKVLNFLNMFGQWDPSLALVMVGGISVFCVGFHFISKKSSRPVLEQQYDLPDNNIIDKPLIVGAVLFGLGWGLTGICPGPALANISGGEPKILVFIVMMLTGMQLSTWFNKAR